MHKIVTTRHICSTTHVGAFDVLKTPTTQVWPETLEKSLIFTLAGTGHCRGGRKTEETVPSLRFRLYAQPTASWGKKEMKIKKPTRKGERETRYRACCLSAARHDSPTFSGHKISRSRPTPSLLSTFGMAANSLLSVGLSCAATTSLLLAGTARAVRLKGGGRGL